jgi:hypothetical protein
MNAKQTVNPVPVEPPEGDLVDDKHAAALEVAMVAEEATFADPELSLKMTAEILAGEDDDVTAAMAEEQNEMQVAIDNGEVPIPNGEGDVADTFELGTAGVKSFSNDDDDGNDFRLIETCKAIVANQFHVNAAMAGEDWVRKAWAHEDVDYRMATLDELAEFWNCAWNFKWWDKKNNTIDYRNARMELVDILHFIVSEDLVLRLEGETDSRAVEWVAKAMLEGVYEAGDLVFGELEGNRLPLLKKAMMKFIHDLTSDGPEVNWTTFWTLVMLSQPEDLQHCQIEVWKVMNLYRAKAVLNKFRTIHRASPRGYKKVWIDGREDNDIMMSWLDLQPTVPSDQELNLWLEGMYHRVIGA